jgi:hypothetical protein
MNNIREVGIEWDSTPNNAKTPTGWIGRWAQDMHSIYFSKERFYLNKIEVLG